MFLSDAMDSNSTVTSHDVWTHPVSLGFRSLFYALTPAESSFQNVDQVPKYVSKVSVHNYARTRMRIGWARCST